MAVTRDDVAQFVIAYFADHFHMPASDFTEDTSLEDDLLYTTPGLVALGSDLNSQHWHNISVKPTEIVECKTIKDVIDLFYGKIAGN